MLLIHYYFFGEPQIIFKHAFLADKKDNIPFKNYNFIFQTDGIAGVYEGMRGTSVYTPQYFGLLRIISFLSFFNNSYF